MARLRCAFAVVTSAWMAAAGPAAASAAAPPTLSWVAPATCPDAASVSREMEDLLGQALQTPRPQAIALEARVDAVGSGRYRARIVAHTAEGRSERVLEHDDCAELAEASALVMALAIDPTLGQRRSEASAPLARPSQHAPGAPVARQRSPEQAWWTRLSWTMSAGAELSLGVLPDPAPAFGAEAGLGDRTQWRVTLGGRYWAGQTVQVHEYPDAEVGMSSWSAAARLCWIPFSGGWRWLGCAGLELGDVRSQGQGAGMTDPRTAHNRRVAAAATTGAELPLARRLFLALFMEGAWVPERHAIGVDGPNGTWFQVARPKPLAASMAVSLGTELP
jgi:hypothetical protein